MIRPALALMLSAAPLAAHGVDDTPRIAVMSAFEPEWISLQADLEGAETRTINGTQFITGTLSGKRLSDLQPFWQRVRARAGVKDVRIHDLRHTFASTAVASGQGLPMIGKLLGHTQVQTTARYAHLAAEPVRMAADAVAQNLRQSLG